MFSLNRMLLTLKNGLFSFMSNVALVFAMSHPSGTCYIASQVAISEQNE